mmetsp:Transcript_7433/g.18449  ORF Transcript_7433/g.18449 Transcript_7433/m.18449 type:complete len:201 (+) Transcript_7433:612-1214(+)
MPRTFSMTAAAACTTTTTLRSAWAWAWARGWVQGDPWPQLRIQSGKLEVRAVFRVQELGRGRLQAAVPRDTRWRPRPALGAAAAAAALPRAPDISTPTNSQSFSPSSEAPASLGVMPDHPRRGRRRGRRRSLRAGRGARWYRAQAPGGWESSRTTVSLDFRSTCARCHQSALSPWSTTCWARKISGGSVCQAVAVAVAAA